MHSDCKNYFLQISWIEGVFLKYSTPLPCSITTVSLAMKFHTPDSNSFALFSHIFREKTYYGLQYKHAAKTELLGLRARLRLCNTVGWGDFWRKNYVEWVVIFA
jgi:hypothetical protein